MGPPMSLQKLSGAMPAREVRPVVERMPTRALNAAGVRMEEPVSVPRPMRPKLAPMAAPVPPELPPVTLRCGACGREAQREKGEVSASEGVIKRLPAEVGSNRQLLLLIDGPAGRAACKEAWCGVWVRCGSCWRTTRLSRP